jgi:predicted RNase H-like HicB family nuclease
MTEMDVLYRINDVLTALKDELGVTFDDGDAEDAALNEATHAVAEALGLEERSPAPVPMDVLWEQADMRLPIRGSGGLATCWLITVEGGAGALYRASAVDTEQSGDPVIVAEGETPEEALGNLGKRAET